MLLAEAGPSVGDVGTDSGGHVGDERPGRGRPHQQAHRAAVVGQFPGGALRGRPRGGRGIQEREAYVDGRIGDQLVAGRHLVRRQRRAAARAVRHHLVALVEQAFLGELAQDPPHRLDITIGHGHVGVVEVQPHADALGHTVPVVHVRGHRLAAQLVELGHAVGLDLLLVIEAQSLLDLEFHRQAVAVPTRFATHEVATHGLVAGIDVLEHARKDMVDTGLAVGRGRTFVEHPFRLAGAQFQALLEDGVLLPPGEDAFLESRKTLTRVYRSILPCHRSSSGRRGRSRSKNDKTPPRAHAATRLRRAPARSARTGRPCRLSRPCRGLRRTGARRDGENPRYHPTWPPPRPPGADARPTLRALPACRSTAP